MEFHIWNNGVFKFFVCSLLIFLLPDLTPNGTFTSYIITPAVELTGPYAVNTLINGAEQLHLGLLKGPETVLALNDELYAGVHGGDVIKVSDKGIRKITKFGAPCDGQWQESKCGRPFGLSTDNSDNLYVADAYCGIWKYNVKTGNKQQLVPHNISIDGRVPRIFNSMAITKSGDIYWTDSSTDVEIQNGVFAMFLDGTGRLIKYSAEKKENTVLADNLYFPNGVVLSPNEEFVVISEMITSRLLRHYVSGPKEGTTDIFLDRLPGFPDKLKVHADYITVPLVHARDASEPVLFQYVSPYTIVRRCIVYFMAFFETIFRILSKIIPLEIFEKILHKIGHFESVAFFAPARVTILFLDWEGRVVDSWHNLDGTLTAISDVQIFNGNVYYGSPYNQYVGKTPIPKTNLIFGNATK